MANSDTQEYGSKDKEVNRPKNSNKYGSEDKERSNRLVLSRVVLECVGNCAPAKGMTTTSSTKYLDDF
jgi:hypothetical protein